ncbi:glycoside hydrolase family 20 protein [Auriscalpium vulgare]|uniref:Glycoside hydrolase family 20 protein n=1 Tax=Auriscalpium vulgare TaxID=40419 RepID=A0ACB8RZ51_9AGAM|nr:glycoside hydrolase family 20 protein [Auriscalpium vulgare]
MSFVLLALVLLLSVFSPARALWPLPRSLQTGSTALTLSPSFNIKLSVLHAPSDLLDAVARTKQYLLNDKLERLVVGRSSADTAAIAGAKTLSALTLQLTPGATARPITTEAQQAPEDRDEAYSLTVPADGSAALITADSTLGLLRGLTTFGQLWYFHSGQLYTLSAPVHVEDSPAYPYRGFMLDTARNFFPVADIKRTLDAMSWVKINTFHWHVVDSQSFPLEVPGFTDVASKGAYSASSVYTPKDVADIVSYAGARGIDVMVEIDTPGHTSVISKAHPEHVACAEATPWSTYANEPPAGQLRFTSDATTNFTANLLAAAAKMFPSKLFSTGGDELNTNCYAADPATQQALNASGQTLEQALNVFTQKTHAAIEAAGKTPVVWEEMVLVHNVTLSNETVVMVWISSDDAAAVAQKGFKIVHAPSDYFYLDCGAGGWVGNFPSGNSWCEPFKTWQKAYSFNPLSGLSADQAKLVLGGQQLLWTEQSGPQNLDSIAWPRAAASAEVFWSGPGGDDDAALPRLHDIAYRFVQRGVQAIALQPEWCALRPGACDI